MRKLLERAFNKYNDKGWLKFISDKTCLKILYHMYFGKKLNLKNPKTFSEKLQWLKLYDRKPEYTTMVDKYAVKKLVADLIGAEHVIPTLGIWDSFDEIDFATLPDQFVLKCTHDSGGLVIVRNKNQFDKAAAKKKIEKCLKRNFFYTGREWPYKNVKPCIIAEQFLEAGEDGLIDYKFFCFNGEPKFLYVSKGLDNHETASISFMTMDWQFAPYGRNDFKPFSELPEKPLNFDKMVEFAKKLSSGFDFLRVDMYSINNKIYFSELTFYPSAGYMPVSNPEHDLEVGNMLVLTTQKNK